MAGSDRLNHCCMKWTRSMVINEKGGLPVRNTCLRVFLALRSRFKLACFMTCIFSAEAYVKHTTEGVLQSFPKAKCRLPNIAMLGAYLK